MLNASELRHRIIIQRQAETQDTTDGAINVSWQNVATLWAAILPLSAKEFIAAQSEASKITTRIVVRYREDITAKMRAVHQAKGMIYNIEGVLSDKDSGLEYITLPCSEGVRYQEGIAVLPINLTLPAISGTPEDGEILSASTGDWANDPVSYTYQWYRNDLSVMGAITSSWVVDAVLNDIITVGIIAVNSAGNSSEALSAGLVITG